MEILLYVWLEDRGNNRTVLSEQTHLHIQIATPDGRLQGQHSFSVLSEWILRRASSNVSLDLQSIDFLLCSS